MASLNLSSNGPSISKSYQAVVDSPLAAGPSRSSTYGQWAVFSVSTPLVNAFQPDSGSKESILKVQATGEGELTELIDEFSEGKIQFAFVKVTDPNTGLPKNVLIAWCGEGVPERTKGYFTSHLSAVSKFLHGYHVQITARSDGDLTPEGIIQKVRDASGSKYTSGAEAPVVAAPKPSVASKPVFTPTRTGGIGSTPVAAIPSITDDNDRWGPDAPPITRTELEKVQPAYKPTKVNMEELKTKKQPTALVSADLPAKDNGDIVRGGYQPVGRVDIGAIRRQAQSAGELKDDRPEPVRGAYEPVGKVDIAAIRSRLQKPTGPTTVDDNSSVPSATTKSDEKAKLPGLPGHSERLTTLPKPRVSNKFGVSPAFTGTKPPLPTNTASKSIATGHIGGASRTFADAGGKTPAQQWAERKAKEQNQGAAPISSSPSSTEVGNQSQYDTTAEWKSSYSGKTWAPVQTTNTGKSVDSSVLQHAEDESLETESLPAQQSISAIREQLASGPSTDVSPSEKPTDTDRTIPLPGLENKPTESETSYGPEAHQPVPSPPQQPRSPTPPTPPPVREASPIRVALPVRRGVTDAHDEQHSPPPVMPIQSLQQAVPDDADLEDNTHEVGGAIADTTTVEPAHGGGIIALVQFDHEKAEDNEVELREGEYVTDIEMVHEDWWLGSNARGERGYFPSNYVEVIEDDQPNRLMPDTRTSGPETDAPGLPADNVTGKEDPTHQSQALSKEPSATAIYDYEAAGDDELSFPEGAEIVNIEFPDDDWWFGEYQGNRGLFPANYVQLDK